MDPEGADSRFQTTLWSVVVRAGGGDGSQKQAALDGQTLASSEIRSGLHFWRFDALREVLCFSLPTACEFLTFSPDCLSLAVNVCTPATAPTKAEVVFVPCPR